MPISFDYTPTPHMKAVFFGRSKRGKTHGMCSLAAMACKLLELPGDIACIATEDWVSDWWDRLSKASGKRIAPLFTQDPKEAMSYMRECEKSPHVSLCLVDCMTELLDLPRQAFVAKNGRAMRIQDYGIVDAPYHALREYMRQCRIHWIATAREADDKQETDGQEIIIGKEAKGKMDEVGRLVVHCQAARMKGGEEQFDWHVKDCSQNEVDRYVGRPKADIWTKYLQRYLAKASEPKVAQARSGAGSKAKGARGEVKLATFLRSRRYAVMRAGVQQRRKGGAIVPDVLAVHFAGGRPLKLEHKNRKGMPAKSHTDALAQAEIAGEGIAIAVAQVPRVPPEQWVATIRLGDLLELYEGRSALAAAMVADAVETELRADNVIGFSQEGQEDDDADE